MPNSKKRGDKSFMPRSWGDASGQKPATDIRSGQTTPQTESEAPPSNSDDSVAETFESTDSCAGFREYDSSYSIDFSQTDTFSVGFSGSPTTEEGAEYYVREAIECETISDGESDKEVTWAFG